MRTVLGFWGFGVLGFWGFVGVGGCLWGVECVGGEGVVGWGILGEYVGDWVLVQ